MPAGGAASASKSLGPEALNREEFLKYCGQWFDKSSYAQTRQMNLAELEELVTQASLDIARMMLAARLKEDPRGHGGKDHACPQCQAKLRLQESRQERTLTTVFGEIRYPRAYGVCDRCAWAGSPLDHVLGIPRQGPSVGVRYKICHASVEGRSFESARRLLKVHDKLTFSRKHIRELAEREGGRLVQKRNEETVSYQHHKLEIQTSDAPELLVIAADGGRVQTRQADKEDRWKEDKIGVVYDAAAKPQSGAKPGDYEGAEAKVKTYVATMQSWESFGWMLRLEADRRGYAKAREKVFLADGARHIRELKDLHFNDAVFILDWAHAAEHVADCAKAAFGEGTPEAQLWYPQHRQMLWDGRIDELIGDIQKLSERSGPPRKDDPDGSPRKVLHQNAYSYFPNNKDAINYPAFRAKGWPIGSGVAEGAIKQFGLRMKGSEKFWNGLDEGAEVSGSGRTGAEEMLALCSLYYSQDGRWDDYWHKRSRPDQRE